MGELHFSAVIGPGPQGRSGPEAGGGNENREPSDDRETPLAARRVGRDPGAAAGGRGSGGLFPRAERRAAAPHGSARYRPLGPDPRRRRSSADRRRQHLPERPRYRDAAQDGDRAQPGGRRARQGLVQGGTGGEGGGPPRRDRPASLPGAARAVRG